MESLAAAVVSPILTKLGDKTASYFGGDITEEELQHLQTVVLPTLLTVTKAAPGVDGLKPWLMALQDAAYEVEELLDIYEYKRLEAQVRSLHDDPLKELKEKVALFARLEAKRGCDADPLKKLKEKLKKKSKSELMKIMDKLRRSADQAGELISLYGPISQIPSLRDSAKQVPTVSSPPSSSVFGRDEERDLLVDMLISTTADVLAICGLGGAGKTTLAQCVYNDSRVVQHFGTRVWVHVSRKFNVERITAQIIESATKGEGSSNITNLDALQMRLKDVLKSKKFLLVLDDVWCEDSTQWDQILAPLNESLDTGSRILVTTRTQEVAWGLGIENPVKLKDLEKEHCMSIFKYYSFGDANKVIHDRELANVAEQIMEKLKKSPLSARMVGSLLRRKKNVAEWKQILLKGEMLKDTMNTLYLSFDNLAPHLQRCFAYCSLYPKGYHFDKGYYFDKVDDLVRLWIAQGFVEAPKDDKMTLEDIGMRYFNELVSSSFFQKEEDYYVIHDLLHDLVGDISKGHCFRIEEDSERIPTNVRHLSILSTKDLPLDIKSDIFKLVNLRTFMVTSDKFDFDSYFYGRNKMFEKFKKLRVLHLGCNVSGLHNSIGELKYLRSLQVEQVNCLPVERLFHLRYLQVEGGELERVPSLPSTLKRLKVFWCENLNEMPSLLSGLRVIDIRYCPKLMQLSPFPPNLEELRIERCPGVETLLSNMLVFEGEDEQPNNLKQKEEDNQQQQQHFPLKKLKIINCCVSVKKRLFSNPNKLFTALTTLTLWELPWLTSLFHPDHKMTSLREIDIFYCENVELIGSPLASISPSLRRLWIRNCPRLTMPDTDGSFLLPSSLEELLFTRCGDPEMNLLGRCLLGLTSLTTLVISGYSDARSLPDLPNPGAIKRLYVSNCRELTSMWNLQPFSSLTHLQIWGCPKIELLPNLPPLERLDITDCHPQLKADYGRDGPLRHKLHHIPRVDIS